MVLVSRKGPAVWPKVPYRTNITLLRPRTGWWLVICSNSRRFGDGETSSRVKWKVGDLMEKELTTYCVRSDDSYMRMSSVSSVFRQGLQRSTKTQPLESRPVGRKPCRGT